MKRSDGKVIRVFVALVLATAFLAGCEATEAPSGDDNPLLGQWMLASGPSDCIQRIIFTQTMEHTWYQGKRRDAAVTDYLVKPNRTYAIGAAGPEHAVGFEFVKPDQVVMHSSSGDCQWERR